MLLNTPPAPNLPAAPSSYNAVTQESTNNALRLFFNRLVNTVSAVTGLNGGKYIQAPNGAWYDTTTQTAAAINTAYAVTLNSTYVENEITKGTPTSRIYTGIGGIYNFQFSMQLQKASASVGYAWIWYRINGVDATNSNSKIAVQGSTAETVAAWNFVVTMQAGDYFELMWATDTDVRIIAQAATAFAPGIPSVIFTTTFVSALHT